MRATGLAIPNTFKQGQAGDKFILLNINMPYNPYVLNAEERLETYVKAELDKVCDAKRAFSIEIYDPFISSFAETNKLITGNYIKIKHTNLIGSGSTATVQIKGITITQSKGDMFPKFAIILSEESSITRPTITRGGGIIGDLYRRYIDLGDRFDNVTRNVSSINTNLGRTINVDTFNNNYIQVSGVNKELIEKIGVLPLDVEDKERTVADLIGNVPKDKTLYTQIEAISLIANEAYRMSRPKDFINVSGIQDESNKTFNTDTPFVLGSSRIYISKDTFFRGVDYIEVDEDTFEFISYAPSEEDFIMFEAIIDN